MPTRSPEERGLLRVEPGHSVSILSDGTSITLPRELDLGLAADRALLRTSVEGRPDLRDLVEARLDGFLSFFPEDHWRRLFNGGQVVVPGAGTHANAYPLRLLLRVTKDLQALARYPGFPAPLRGFRNPPQVPSALFEVLAATWCRTRDVTVGLEFAPVVVRATHTKRPEFRWKTELGDLFCECKQANVFEAKYGARYHDLFGVLASAHGTREWDPHLRLDVWIRLAGPRLEDLLRDLVSAAAGRQQLGRVPWNRDHRLAAIFRPRTEMPPDVPDTIFGFRQHVSDVERPASPQHAPFFLTLDVSKSRKAATSHLLKEARLQLPPDRASAVFLSVGGPEAAVAKVRELIVQGSYRLTPLVLVFAADGQVRAVSRAGQAFDRRLVEPRKGGLASGAWRWLRAPMKRSFAWCLGRV